MASNRDNRNNKRIKSDKSNTFDMFNINVQKAEKDVSRVFDHARSQLESFSKNFTSVTESARSETRSLSDYIVKETTRSNREISGIYKRTFDNIISYQREAVGSMNKSMSESISNMSKQMKSSYESLFSDMIRSYDGALQNIQKKHDEVSSLVSKTDSYSRSGSRSPSDIKIPDYSTKLDTIISKLSSIGVNSQDDNERTINNTMRTIHREMIASTVSSPRSQDIQTIKNLAVENFLADKSIFNKIQLRDIIGVSDYSSVKNNTRSTHDDEDGGIVKGFKGFIDKGTKAANGDRDAAKSLGKEIVSGFSSTISSIAAPFTKAMTNGIESFSSSYESNFNSLAARMDNVRSDNHQMISDIAKTVSSNSKIDGAISVSNELIPMLNEVAKQGFTGNDAISKAMSDSIDKKIMPWLETSSEAWVNMTANLSEGSTSLLKAQQLQLQSTQSGNRLLQTGIINSLTSDIEPLLRDIEYNTTKDMSKENPELLALMESYMNQGFTEKEAYRVAKQVVDVQKDQYGALTSGDVSKMLMGMSAAEGGGVADIARSVKVLTDMAASSGSDLNASAVGNVTGLGTFVGDTYTTGQSQRASNALGSIGDYVNKYENATVDDYNKRVDNAEQYVSANEKMKNEIGNAAASSTAWINAIPGGPDWFSQVLNKLGGGGGFVSSLIGEVAGNLIGNKAGKLLSKGFAKVTGKAGKEVAEEMAEQAARTSARQLTAGAGKKVASEVVEEGTEGFIKNGSRVDKAINAIKSSKLGQKVSSGANKIIGNYGDDAAKMLASGSKFTSKALPIAGGVVATVEALGDTKAGVTKANEWFVDKNKGGAANASQKVASGTAGFIAGSGPSEGIFDKNASLLEKGMGIGGNALKGAGIGAAIGSIIPGIGTAIGGAVGGLVGGISAAIGPKNIAKTFGMVTDGAKNLFMEFTPLGKVIKNFSEATTQSTSELKAFNDSQKKLLDEEQASRKEQLKASKENYKKLETADQKRAELAKLGYATQEELKTMSEKGVDNLFKSMSKQAEKANKKREKEEEKALKDASKRSEKALQKASKDNQKAILDDLKNEDNDDVLEKKLRDLGLDDKSIKKIMKSSDRKRDQLIDKNLNKKGFMKDKTLLDEISSKDLNNYNKGYGIENYRETLSSEEISKNNKRISEISGKIRELEEMNKSKGISKQTIAKNEQTIESLKEQLESLNNQAITRYSSGSSTLGSDRLIFAHQGERVLNKHENRILSSLLSAFPSISDVSKVAKSAIDDSASKIGSISSKVQKAVASVDDIGKAPRIIGRNQNKNENEVPRANSPSIKDNTNADIIKAIAEGVDKIVKAIDSSGNSKSLARLIGNKLSQAADNISGNLHSTESNTRVI